MKENPFFHKLLEVPEQRGRYMLILRQIPLFYALSHEECLALLKHCNYVAYEAGEAIFSEGDSGRTLHIVVQGETVVTRPKRGDSSDKHAGVLSVKTAGSMLGEIAFFCNTPRSASAHAGDGGTDHLVLTNDGLLDLKTDSPNVIQNMLQSLIEGMGKRLQRLPAMYFNYVLFGYLPEKTSSANAESTTDRPMSPFVYGLLGALYGMLLGYVVVWALGQKYAFIAAAKQAVLVASQITAILCGVVGIITGFVLNRGAGEKRRIKQDDRNCGNCKFVVWEEGGERYDCMMLLAGARTPGIRPSERFDTYTECTGFELKKFGTIERRARDDMSNLD